MKNSRNRGKPKSADGHSSDMKAAGIDFNPGPHAPGAAEPTLHCPAEAARRRAALSPRGPVAGRRQRRGRLMRSPQTLTVTGHGAHGKRGRVRRRAGLLHLRRHTLGAARRPTDGQGAARFRRAAHEEMAHNGGGCPPVGVLQGRRRRAGAAGTRPATGNRPTSFRGDEQRATDGNGGTAHAPFPSKETEKP